MAREPTQTKSTPKGLKFKMVTSPLPPEEIYVDGISGVLARPEVVKLDCYRVFRVDATDRTEVRGVTHRLVLPMRALRDLAALTRGITSRQQGRKPATRGAAKSNGGSAKKSKK